MRSNKVMEVHPRMNSVVAKRLWNALRLTFFMIRKGLMSKRKMIRDLNLMMKRGKLLGKSLGNILSHHQHHHSRQVARGSFGIREYEFSCSNSPNPVFFHVHKRKHHYFPCINPPNVVEYEQGDDDQALQEAEAVALVPKTPEYTFNFQFDAHDFLPGEKRSPLVSPFSISVSDYSSEDDENDGSNKQVDAEAEEFISRFYDQLRAQRRIQLLQYQEMEYQDMLARGA